jgi:hypothetical protein
VTFSISGNTVQRPINRARPTQRRNPRRLVPALVVSKRLHERIPRSNELIRRDSRKVGDTHDHHLTLPKRQPNADSSGTSPSTKMSTWNAWNKFVPIADDLYDEHLTELPKEGLI